jgi:hypothetical protein
MEFKPEKTGFPDRPIEKTAQDRKGPINVL